MKFVSQIQRILDSFDKSDGTKVIICAIVGEIRLFLPLPS